MTTDYRALCAELADAYTWCIEECMKAPAEEDTLIQRAHAALASEPEPPAEGEVAELVACLSDSLQAFGFTQQLSDYPIDHWSRRAADLLERLVPQPVPEGPSKAELRQLFLDHSGYIDDEPAMFWSDFYASVRAALARWGTSTLAQVRSSLGDGPQPVPEGPSDHELTMTYAYAVSAAVGNKRGPFKNEDAEAAQLAGLRAVLARWGHAPNA